LIFEGLQEANSGGNPKTSAPGRHIAYSILIEQKFNHKDILQLSSARERERDYI
jgi:hypothetical protein